MIEMDQSEHLDILTDDESTYYAIDRFFEHNRTITEKLLYPKPRAAGETDELKAIQPRRDSSDVRHHSA